MNINKPMDKDASYINKKRKRGLTTYQKVDNDIRVRLLNMVNKPLTSRSRKRR
jgi:hypothetical protein